MLEVTIASVVIFFIAIIMAITGRGGGNFYVPILIVTGLAMHEAATVAQLILFCTAVAALLVFQKSRTVDWKLALVIDPPTDIMAFVGGYYAHVFSGGALKLIFAFLLVIAGFFMLFPVKERVQDNRKRFGFWHRKFGDNSYVVNLWVAIPIPLMVLACGVPIRIAIGTSSAMVAVTALMGFLGHTAGGDFNPYWAIPLMIMAVLGGLIGGGLSLKTKTDNLKRIFAYTTLVAAVFMLVNALTSV